MTDRKRPEGTWFNIECPVCKKDFKVLRSYYRHRLAKSKTGKLYCSNSCVAARNAGEG